MKQKKHSLTQNESSFPRTLKSAKGLITHYFQYLNKLQIEKQNYWFPVRIHGKLDVPEGVGIAL